MARQHSVLAIVLAGGEGKRLHPLTEDRCKPAVPFGGRYRIVDFVLSNLVNSGIFRIIVLTQFKSQSLIRHIQRGWQMSGRAGHFIEIVPAQMRRGPHWYRGSGDAIYQNLDILGAEPGEIICVFGADH
ncbi:MAG: NTP transferase domain-containing protein, partial [Myxococcales bacterium]|nr:NTP transferase domain-containing protein [Myxococcales bacterium]